MPVRQELKQLAQVLEQAHRLVLAIQIVQDLQMLVAQLALALLWLELALVQLQAVALELVQLELEQPVEQMQ